MANVGRSSATVRKLGSAAKTPSQLIVALCVIPLMCLISSTAAATVIISEFMAANDSVLFDQDGDAEDWIELHNTGSEPVDLDNWYLSDDANELTAWQFPSTVLEAGDYLVVFASDKDLATSGSELHTNFKLSAGGEYLALVMPDGSTLASQYSPEYPRQFDDISYGGGRFFLEPTPGAENSAGVTELEGTLELSLEHGFFDSPQILSMASNLPNGTIRYTLDGSTPASDIGCDAPADGQPWSYQYYEGAFGTLPDFDSLSATASGTTGVISTDVRLRDENFGLVFTGCIHATAEGFYTFTTTSDDSSQLLIDGQLVLDNSNAGSASTVSSEIALDEGLHEVVVRYFQGSGNNELTAEWIAPMRGDTYALTPNEGSVSPADPDSNDFVEFEFDLPADGVFDLNALVRGPNGAASSFWVQLDDGPLWLYQIPELTEFSLIGLNNDNVNLTPALSKGEHKLKFFVRQDGAGINALQIDAISCEGPCDTQLIQAEIEDVSGDFVLAGLDPEPIPAVSWFTYSQAIQIESTSIVRAIAIQENFVPSEIVTQSYLFTNDILTQSPNQENPTGWPEGDVNGQDLDYGMDPDIVNPDPQAVKDALLSLPSVSIVTDIDNLLHPEIGIYVNAEQKGRAWERPASIELIDPNNNEPGFTIDAGIRIRGGFSRRSNNPKHPFRLFFRGSYGGDLNYPLFGQEGVTNFEKVDLRSPNNYSWAFFNDHRNTLLREIWSRDTQAALGHAYTRSRYYHLYINGQYWGVNMTQERVSKEFAESYFGGDEDDYDVVKHNRDHNKRYEASDGFNDSWNQIWETIADQTVSNAEYAFLEQQVDIDNLIDYILGNAYEGELDGATSWFSDWIRANNWFGVRDRENGRLKWTFFQHDGEHTLGARPSDAVAEVTVGPHAPFNGQANQFYTRDYMNPYWIHGALANNPEYQQRFIDRVAEVFADGGVLSNENGLTRWLNRKAQVQPAILAHSARWGDAKNPNNPFTIDDWQAEVDLVENTVFADRAEIVFDQLLGIGLASDIELPRLSVTPGSVVTLGTLIDLTDLPDGTIYYTLDGSDPRAVGGAPSDTALELVNGESIEITADTTGTSVTVTSVSDGQIYYTLDGSDPRTENGEPADNAILLSNGDNIVIESEIELTLRVFANGVWSSIVSAQYQVQEPVGDETCFAIKTKNDNVVLVLMSSTKPYGEFYE